MEPYKAVEIAAIMLNGDPASAGLLHTDLYDTLEKYNVLCGVEALTRSGVAAVVIAWELANPGEPAICDG